MTPSFDLSTPLLVWAGSLTQLILINQACLLERLSHVYVSAAYVIFKKNKCHCEMDIYLKKHWFFLLIKSMDSEDKICNSNFSFSIG